MQKKKKKNFEFSGYIILFKRKKIIYIFVALELTTINCLNNSVSTNSKCSVVQKELLLISDMTTNKQNKYTDQLAYPILYLQKTAQTSST